ncbi:MAG: polymer-forming cytoskeletal protein [Gammaproteobacteria bacterium]|nr:polymer-forming cytoskeletal protein [Gammaproteobacteria bacterium]
MWGNTRKKKSTKIDTLVGENTELTGDVNFVGGLHVDGIVKGNISADTDTNSLFSLSEQGTIEGEINVPYNVIDGTVIGNIYGSKHVELEAKSRITGDVYYNLLEIASGAQISGRLVHTPDAGEAEPKLIDDITSDDYN